VGGGEEDGWSGPQAEHGDLLAAKVVDQGEHVVGDRLEEPLLDMGHRVRCTPAPGVEPDRPAERGQSAQEPGERRLVPHQVDGKGKRVGHEQIDATVADDLVRDAAHARLGEAGLGNLGHDRTVCRAQHRGARLTGLNCRHEGRGARHPRVRSPAS
jgi:hypothetical protein